MTETTENIPAQSTQLNDRRALTSGVLCYLLWGLLPVFWKLLSAIPSAEVQAHRMLWCALCVFVFCLITKTHFVHLFKDKRAVLVFLASGVLITINWLVYVFDINTGHAIDASLGSYLTPTVNVIIGVLLFKERPSLLQGIAIGLATVGILILTTSSGEFPTSALVLAVSFALYGGIKKWGGYPASEGMALENLFTGALGLAAVIAGMIFPALFAALTPVENPASYAISPDAGLPVFLLLVAGGLVTWLPLQLFAKAVNGLSMITISFCQYISPTLCLLCAIFLFEEPFTWADIVCFALIWIGISLEIVHETRMQKAHRNGVPGKNVVE
ncbi:MAG: EamA family transporter RarD [Eggerthellaceae bacterium]|nr:EamA family transporter RarD [Eggerthellaceae bacterium]